MQANTRLNPGVSLPHTGSELEAIASEDQAKQPHSTVSRSGSLSPKRSQEMSDNHSAEIDLVGAMSVFRRGMTALDSDDSVPVLLECCGRQSSLIHPELCTEPTATCIGRQTCHGLFAPDQFVGHTHTVTEVDYLNHWRLDSNNGRCCLRPQTGSHGRVVGPDPGWSQCMGIGREDELENSPPKGLYLGLCASVAPIPPGAIFSPQPTHEIPDSRTSEALDHFIKNTLSTALQPLTKSREPNRNPTIPMGPLSSSASTPAPILPPLSSSLSSVLLPQLTSLRLWAPNNGRIKVPPPPRPNSTGDKNVLPKKLHTGPPILLHSHCVVSQAAADQYDRGFIPNSLCSPVRWDRSGLDCPHQHKYRRHHHHTHHQRNQRQNRASAAAKAARGAASRISPGLWSRHFANLKGNNGTKLDLLNAREPATMDAASSNPNGTTPVLVTRPSTNSLPSAVLSLESLWTDLVHQKKESRLPWNRRQVYKMPDSGCLNNLSPCKPVM
ncbi:hypothetical protein D915_005930 [Fasciola hepatica]|uniref:c-SKI SMAD4-binding domain-containing protein n=1 Tax=Fasciola hepatica TaxID=6192 RepID=A0A4E0R5V3_FASHE|nr:hypothetical protein D915_005930 [Fasciola hepatica]